MQKPSHANSSRKAQAPVPPPADPAARGSADVAELNLAECGVPVVTPPEPPAPCFQNAGRHAPALVRTPPAFLTRACPSATPFRVMVERLLRAHGQEVQLPARSSPGGAAGDGSPSRGGIARRGWRLRVRVARDSASAVDLIVFEESVGSRERQQERQGKGPGAPGKDGPKGNAQIRGGKPDSPGQDGGHDDEGVHCEHCRVLGWGHHPVSCASYHFIVPLPSSRMGVGGKAHGRTPRLKSPSPPGTPKARLETPTRASPRLTQQGTHLGQTHPSTRETGLGEGDPGAGRASQDLGNGTALKEGQSSGSAARSRGDSTTLAAAGPAPHRVEETSAASQELTDAHEQLPASTLAQSTPLKGPRERRDSSAQAAKHEATAVPGEEPVTRAPKRLKVEGPQSPVGPTGRPAAGKPQGSQSGKGPAMAHVGRGYKRCRHCDSIIPSNTKRCKDCQEDCMAQHGEAPPAAPQPEPVQDPELPAVDWNVEEMVASPDHLLHGLVHANGFGHLLRINGRERGSLSLSGGQLVSLWDALCALLNVREASCLDVSKKMGLDLRLLHTLAYGMPWYGRWGYKFARGSYGVTEDVYSFAVANLCRMPLSSLLKRTKGLDPDLAAIVQECRNAGEAASAAATPATPAATGETQSTGAEPAGTGTAGAAQDRAPMESLSDLVRFLFRRCRAAAASLRASAAADGASVLSPSHRASTPPLSHLVIPGAPSTGPDYSPRLQQVGASAPGARTEVPSSAWSEGVPPETARRIAEVQGLLFQVLLEDVLERAHRKGGWMWRAELRRRGRALVGDLGILDSAIKGLAGMHFPGGWVVQRRIQTRAAQLRVVQETQAELDVLGAAGTDTLGAGGMAEAHAAGVEMNGGETLGEDGTASPMFEGPGNALVTCTAKTEHRDNAAACEPGFAKQAASAWSWAEGLPRPSLKMKVKAKAKPRRVLCPEESYLRYVYRNLVEGASRTVRVRSTSNQVANGLPQLADHVLFSKYLCKVYLEPPRHPHPAPGAHEKEERGGQGEAQGAEPMQGSDRTWEKAKGPLGQTEAEDGVSYLWCYLDLELDEVPPGCVPPSPLEPTRKRAAGARGSRPAGAGAAPGQGGNLIGIPPELIAVPHPAKTPSSISATKLKPLVQKTFRDLYPCLAGFRVKSLEIKMECISDPSSIAPALPAPSEAKGRAAGASRNERVYEASTTAVLLPLAPSMRCVLVAGGAGAATLSPWFRIGGSVDWLVDCTCGARDDDGERMVSCDRCAVWQHTLCNQIGDSDPPPASFACSRCFEEVA